MTLLLLQLERVEKTLPTSKKSSRTSKKTTAAAAASLTKDQRTSPRKGKASSSSGAVPEIAVSTVVESSFKKSKSIPVAVEQSTAKSSRRRAANKNVDIVGEAMNVDDSAVKKVVVEEKPKRFSTLETSPSNAEPPLFSPRKLRSTRKNDAPGPSTLKKIANVPAKGLKTPAPAKSFRQQQAVENTFGSVAPPSTRSRSLRPRK